MESGFSALPWESGFCFQPWNLGFLFCYRTRGWQGLAQFLANGLRFQYLLLQLVEFHAFLCAGRWRRSRLGPETSVVKLANSFILMLRWALLDYVIFIFKVLHEAEEASLGIIWIMSF